MRSKAEAGHGAQPPTPMPDPPTDNQGGTAVGPRSFRTGPRLLPTVERPARSPPVPFLALHALAALRQMLKCQALPACVSVHTLPLWGVTMTQRTTVHARGEKFVRLVTGQRMHLVGGMKTNIRCMYLETRDTISGGGMRGRDPGEAAKRDAVSWQEQVSVGNILGVSEMIEMKERDRPLQC